MQKPPGRRVMSSHKPNRRLGAVEEPLFGKLLVEADWKPQEPLEPRLEAWARAKGLLDDRRRQDRRASPTRSA